MPRALALAVGLCLAAAAAAQQHGNTLPNLLPTMPKLSTAAPGQEQDDEAPPPAPAGPRIPLQPGLVLAAVATGDAADEETQARITTADKSALTVAIRTARAEGTLQASRTLLRADLAQADSVRHRFNADDAPSFPGTTALGVSTRVLRQLRDSGRSAITLDVGAIAPRATEAGVGLDTELDRQLHAAGGFEGIEEAVNRGVERGELTAGERAQGARTVADIPRLGLATGRLRTTGRLQVPVIVNDRPVRLDALTAIGSLSNGRDEVAVSMAILDDPDNPLLLRLQIGDVLSEVTRIGYAQSSVTYASQIEQALIKACRVDVYGLGFDPGADQLPPGSDETVAALRRALGRHPDWKVAVLSHDGDASAALSLRRAQAISDALAQDDGARVVAVPLPRPAPLTGSDTAAGRALNRRTTFSRTGCPQ